MTASASIFPDASVSAIELVPEVITPFEPIEKSDAPVDEATLNGLTPADPCTLNEKLVDVPVERSTMPWVPEALVESRNTPRSERLVDVALVAVREVTVVVARVTVEVAVSVPVTRFEVVALVAMIPFKNVLMPAND